MQRYGLAALSIALSAATIRADVGVFQPSKDNTIYISASGALSSGIGDGMFIGDNGNGETRRSFIAFNLTSIPPGSTINSASLSMYVTRTRAGNRTGSLYKVTADWGEGPSGAPGNGGSGFPAEPGDVTWIHRFYNNVFWNTPGGDTVTNPSASTSVGGIGSYSWSGAGMVADIQAWVNAPGTNFGWMIKGDESSSTTAKRIATREYPTVSLRPTLTINFTPPANAGACCFTLGNCSLLPPDLCSLQGGTFAGVGTTCNPNTCPQPTGGCCLPSLDCVTLTQAACTSAGGIYQGNFFPCSPGLCTIPTGACCFANGTCQVLRQADCSSASGVYQGNSIACGANLCPIILTPFVDALPLVPTAVPTTGFPGGAATYNIAAREFVKTLHRDLPATRMWGYNGQYPGPTIEAFRNQLVNVTWSNDLRDATGALRQHHYLPVDMCLHGPMQEGDVPRLVTHLHGAHVEAASDGFPEYTQLPGESSFAYRYPNTQLPATLWYHDHALGITRLNVYMGLAGFYLLRDSTENNLGLPSGPNEVPLILQDKSFNPDGSLRYPAMWDEHWFGDFTIVNGKIWPFMNVNKGKYRFRLVNGAGSRTYRLALSNGASFTMIGSDGGLLTAPVSVPQITLMPGERADFIVDFAPYTTGAQIDLVNSAPAPFPGTPGVGVTPNVMRFVVQSAAGHTAAIPATLRTVTPMVESTAVVTREFQLQRVPGTCPSLRWLINGKEWDEITEFVHLDTNEIWSFVNRSDESHPMHIHLTQFQVLDRQDYEVNAGQVVPVGPRQPPPPEESGWKDTVQCPPGRITRVIARFTEHRGTFVYHCHVLEHEDGEMMRQFKTTCYVNCDFSTGTPLLTANDFQCFLNRFAANSMYANCDGSTGTPALTANDFQCFMSKFASGCP